MSGYLDGLLREVLLGRYKNGPWGYVPYPRIMPKVSQVGLPENLERAHSVAYERLVRHRERLKPVGWPFGRHSLIDMEEHLKKFLGHRPETRLIIDQLLPYIKFFKNGTQGVSQRIRSGATAFRKLWWLLVISQEPECPKCQSQVRHRERVSVGKVAKSS